MEVGKDRPLRVLLACSGLDHARRGFESFARDCFTALRDLPELELTLVKGSGEHGPNELTARTLTRDAALARALARGWRREPFRVEQVAFALSLQPALRRLAPDVVYFSEWHTGLVLGRTRRVTRQPFRMALCNGTMAFEGFEHLDLVQELTPSARELALAHGAEPARHEVLPLGFPIAANRRFPAADERRALRERLGLPGERPMVISVAALNRHHKRLDWLIEEVALMPDRPFLLMVGQPEAETPGLRALAAERLAGGHAFRSVPQTEVAELLRAADVFTLASLGEGLPRALVEALAEGKQCVTHDYPVTRYVLAEHGIYADLTRRGELAAALARGIEAADAPGAAQARHDSARERFSWDALRPRYVELLRHAASRPLSRAGRSARRRAPRC